MENKLNNKINYFEEKKKRRKKKKKKEEEEETIYIFKHQELFTL